MDIFGKYILPILGYLLVFGIPLVCVIVSGSFIRGVFWTWFLLILWYLSWNGLTPIFDSIGEEPVDGPSLFLTVVFGWFYGLIVSGLGILSRKLVLKYRPSLIKKREAEIINERAEGPEVT